MFQFKVNRRKSRKIWVGKVPVGNDTPITVQSMTNTLTSDSAATIAQILQLQTAGADIVRVSCPDQDSTLSLKHIIKAVDVPIVADIHFHYKRAIEAAQAGAACLRINPGNIGDHKRIAQVVQAAKDYNCSIRIGVNAGSLENDILKKYSEPCPEALLESALRHIAILEDHDFFNFKISVKASNVALAVESYRLLAKHCDYPLHLGITEAGSYRPGMIKSAIGLGMLLYEGIGDTLRVSLSADPIYEIQAGFDILKALGMRTHGVTIISCPSCARQGFDVIKTVQTLEEKLEHIQMPLTISIIGCVVNGPGEALQADIGFTGGNQGSGMLYIRGQAIHKLSNQNMIDHIVAMVEEKQSQWQEKALI